MHCPITVIKAGPMATPTRAASDQKLWAIPLAAIWAVPNRAVTLLSATLISWNIPFSTPLGTATRRMRRIMSLCQPKMLRIR